MRLKQSLQSAGRQEDRETKGQTEPQGTSSLSGCREPAEQKGEVCLSGAVLPLLPSQPPRVLCSADVSTKGSTIRQLTWRGVWEPDTILKQVSAKEWIPQRSSEHQPGPHLLLQGLPHLLDACAFDEVRQLKGGLLNASFAL